MNGASEPSLAGRCLCGETGWTFAGDPGSITACNCSMCARYGTLWAYDYENERICLDGATRTFTRRGKADPALEIHFCPACGCVLGWRGLRIEADGRRRMAINIRLAPAGAVANLPIDHFDGADTFEDLPPDGRCVRDMWF
ncbi:MAG: hypothetical protein JHC57_07760 [Sphingopyxis sp.]|uniref:GFA family protein n=1 Tax=Sphingopyxis sp. TaxID=1908224 RepID=UPI001A25D428|nr:hypothetical protein [Sphingopyxis sp.]MBJ7499632.1 hypothetical protein [Sphingopyxis sp.]